MSELDQRRSAGAIAVIVAVFLAGAGSGVAIDRYVISHRAVDPERTGPSELKGPDGRRLSPEMRRAVESGIPFHIERLNLTPEQRQALIEIARRRRPQADSIMRTLRPVTSHLETVMMQEMLCALTPAQQEHWLAYMDTTRFDPAVVAERYEPIKQHTCDQTRR